MSKLEKNVLKKSRHVIPWCVVEKKEIHDSKIQKKRKEKTRKFCMMTWHSIPRHIPCHDFKGKHHLVQHVIIQNEHKNILPKMF
jgi:hypothetical protein